MIVGIIGLGLMGGSFARTLIKKDIAKVYGYDVSESVLAKAELLNAITDRLTLDNVGDVDMLVLGIFPKDVKDTLTPYLARMKKGAVVLDFCGVKRKVVAVFEELSKEYPSVYFIGGHPMAGREFSGIEHSTASLFDKASMILTPVNADIFLLDSLKKFFLSVGFTKVVVTNAENHDRMIAFTSQLCHVVSNNYIKNKSAISHDGYSAGSYRDLTRVARLNPKMWSELIFDNQDYLLSELDEFIDNLKEYREAIASNDKDKLETLLKEGNDLKMEIDVRSKNATKS